METDLPIVAVYLYGPHMATALGVGLFVTSENPVRAIAQRLLDRGENSTRPVELYRGGMLVERTTLAKAAEQ